MHPWRRPELYKEAVASIATSTDDEALEALGELHNRRMFQRGSSHSLTLLVSVEVDGKCHYLKGLVDSGCEGSFNHCIVKRLGLKMKKLTRTIPVFNADGQPNMGGPVMEVMRLDVEVAG
jgi:hypothetical protein